FWHSTFGLTTIFATPSLILASNSRLLFSTSGSNSATSAATLIVDTKGSFRSSVGSPTYKTVGRQNCLLSPLGLTSVKFAKISSILVVFERSVRHKYGTTLLLGKSSRRTAN